MDTEVAVLIERETLELGEGVGDDELDDDWATTVATKPSPRRRAAVRKRERTEPAMAVVVGGRGRTTGKVLRTWVDEESGDKRSNESDARSQLRWREDVSG